MVAGSIGIRVKNTEAPLDNTRTHTNGGYFTRGSGGELIPVEHHCGTPQAPPGPDSLQSEAGWIMFEAPGLAVELQKSSKITRSKIGVPLTEIETSHNVWCNETIIIHATCLIYLSTHYVCKGIN